MASFNAGIVSSRSGSPNRTATKVLVRSIGCELSALVNADIFAARSQRLFSFSNAPYNDNINFRINQEKKRIVAKKYAFFLTNLG